ncbi:MAG: hypothetical protein HFF09_05900 [Oscillospiraceae bacterium]|nr:hypothetical protein [Oscillospiraceae bacterium]
MLFKKSMEPRCAYCVRGKALGDGSLACPKKGVVAGNFSCGSFRYDPLKRQPPRPASADFSKLTDDDFSL